MSVHSSTHLRGFQDMATDVLAVSFTSIKSAELIVQDGTSHPHLAEQPDLILCNTQASRMLVEFEISEPPLISSSREPVETPAGHKAGEPLKLCVSIALSDVIGFEAALSARNLVR
jgi:hypothetical protein